MIMKVTRSPKGSLIGVASRSHSELLCSEYMIGRMSGKYPPPGNPLLYRIKNSNTNKGHIVHQYKNDKSVIHFNQLDSMHNLI
jgi:hypothetical protein